MSRSAFYTHFADLGDLARQMQAPHIAEIAARAAGDRSAHPHEAMRASQHALAEHFAEYRPLYAAAFSLPGSRTTRDLEQTILRAITAHIDTIGGPPPGLRSDLAASYVAAAATRVIEEWMTGLVVASADEIAEHLYQLMPPWLHAGNDSSASAGASGKEDR